MSREDEIRLIAHRIWEEEGFYHGHDIEHWLRAEAVWEQEQRPKKVAVETETKLKPVPKQRKGIRR